MDFLILDAIDFDESINLLAVVGIKTERVKNLGETDMRQVIRYFFRADANAPQLDDSTHRHASFVNHWLPVRVGNDVGVVCCSAHAHTIHRIPMNCPRVGREDATSAIRKSDFLIADV